MRVQLLSKHWHTLVEDPKLWELINENVKSLSILERLRIDRCLAERRSKGKLFVTTDRCSSKKYLLRKIFLDVTNAGQDDGLPTSVLREIAHLKALDHPNVGKIF
jgi:hypothetical protein